MTDSTHPGLRRWGRKIRRANLSSYIASSRPTWDIYVGEREALMWQYTCLVLSCVREVRGHRWHYRADKQISTSALTMKTESRVMRLGLAARSWLTEIHCGFLMLDLCKFRQNVISASLACFKSSVLCSVQFLDLSHKRWAKGLGRLAQKGGVFEMLV